MLPELDLPQKALHCAQMMSLARAIAERLDTDDERRIVGRFVLVYLDSYIPLARRLRKLANKPKQSAPLKTDINKLADDYHGYYDRIRDKLSAHRQDLPIDEAWDTWNEIDAATVAIFVDDAIATYNQLVTIDPSLPTFVAVAAEGGAQLVRPSPASQAPAQLKFSADTLAMTRGEAGIVPTHVVQVRGGEVLSVIHMLNATIELVGRVGLDVDTRRLLKTMLIVDLCNLYDLIYGREAGRDPGQPSLLEIFEAGGSGGRLFDGAVPLRASVAKLDLAALDELRFLRNKICAHIDWALSLQQLLAALDGLADEFFNDLFRTPLDAFVAACRADPATNILLMLGRPLTGLTRAEPIGQRPFD